MVKTIPKPKNEPGNGDLEQTEQKDDQSENQSSKIIKEEVKEDVRLDYVNKIEHQNKWDRNGKLPPQMMKRWFGGGPHTDEEIKMLF